MSDFLGVRTLTEEDPEYYPYKDYDTSDWMAYFLNRYGWIDGERHKQWVIDQAMRIYHGTPVVIKYAEWGTADEVRKDEYRVETGEPSEDYLTWFEINGFSDEDRGAPP